MPAYPKTSPKQICVRIVCKVFSSVVLGGGEGIPVPSHSTCPTVFCPGKTKFSPMTIVPQENFPGGEFTPTRKLHFALSPFHYWWKCAPKKRFTIGQFHHITITPKWFHHFTISAKNIDSPLHHLENKQK